VANTNAHIYAREEQILAVRMIVLFRTINKFKMHIKLENEESEQHLTHVVA